MAWKRTATIERGKLLVCKNCGTPATFDERWGWVHVEPFEKIPCAPWAKLADRELWQQEAPSQELEQ